MKMKIQITSRIQILLGLVAGVTASFLQAPPNQLQSTFNSTFLTQQGKLYRPIVIPNSTEQTYTSKPNLQKLKITDKEILKNILENEENYSGGEVKPNENRFSSRYSLKEQTVTEADDSEEKIMSITDIPVLLERGEPISSKISLPSPPKAKPLSKRLDIVDDSEEEKADGHQYFDSSETIEREESEITSTTSEPYSELRTATSIRTSPDDHFENYETSSGIADERDDYSEEKRSLHDYRDSGSKNYHSIQTPLNRIKYKGPQSLSDDFEKIKKPISSRLRLMKHNWPYTGDKIETELGENEISNSEESKRLGPEERSKEEQREPTKDVGLELAELKDESRFNRTRPHNHIDERRRRKEQEKNLAAEEEKDRRSPFYKTLKKYTADGEEPKYQTTENIAKVQKNKNSEKTPTVQPTKKPKNIFFNYNQGTATKSEKFNNSKELTLDFPVHRFLGPVVFSKDSKVQTTTKSYPKKAKPYNIVHRDFLKNLEQKEKLDQDNQKFDKSVLTSENAKYQSFNHIEESDEMYNAILAHIQSVFGLRTQPQEVRGGRKNQPEVNLEESSALTWSVPLIKRQVKSYEGVLESVTLKGSDGKVKSGREGATGKRKFLFPAAVSQPEQIGSPDSCIK